MSASIATIPESVLADLAKIDPHAVKLLSDFGPCYFNPIIGATRTETFGNLERGLNFLHDLIDGDFEFGESRAGLALFVETMWGAAQYERDRLGRETVDGGTT